MVGRLQRNLAQGRRPAVSGLRHPLDHVCREVGAGLHDEGRRLVADGRALALLINHYQHSLLPRAAIATRTSAQVYPCNTMATALKLAERVVTAFTSPTKAGGAATAAQ